MDDDDVRVPTPLERVVAWLGPPRSYVMVRNAIVRLLGVIYVFAFLGIVLQGLPLLGHHGLTPIDTYVDQLRAAGATVWDVPSLLMFDASDTAIRAWAVVGLVIAVPVALGYANLPMLLVLWIVYGSFERLGQTWFSFGWEMQLLETTLLVAAMVHPWDLRPRPPTGLSIVLMRWFAFRIMLGAGLIKWRGDPCWRELTCLDSHFETQPVPNPLSPLFHHLPHALHAAGVAVNHAVELIAPWFVFGPRRLRLVAGCALLAFQLTLIASGNLAFLNWLTVVPVLACFDDDVLRRFVPRRWRPEVRAGLPTPHAQVGVAIAAMIVVVLAWAPATGWLGATGQVVLGAALVAGALIGVHWLPWRVARWQCVVGLFAGLVAVKSCDVIENLASSHQAMNRGYDVLDLVNTYGAFGSVGSVRHELVIEGTLVADPAAATWQAFVLPCQPGPLDRRPCVLGPYHRRLDWLIWFAAMHDHPADAWVLHLVYKLLDGDRGVRELLADPFAGVAPRWVRIRRFVYHLAPYGADTWWTRDHEELWLPPIARDDEALLDVLGQFGWPSPTLR